MKPLVRVAREGETTPGTDYLVIDEQGDRLVLEKATSTPSADQLHERHATRSLSDSEFAEYFGDVPYEHGE